MTSVLFLRGRSLLAVAPELHADRTATFRIHAPGAKQVQIDVKGRTSTANDEKPFDMTKDSKGDWSYTTKPLDPGFHYYFVIIDGFRCADSIWIGYGTEDPGFPRSTVSHKSLEEQRIRHEYFTHPGTHEWQTWRRHLHFFAQKLFID